MARPKNEIDARLDAAIAEMSAAHRRADDARHGRTFPLRGQDIPPGSDSDKEADRG